MGVCSLPETATFPGLHGCLAQEETPRRCHRDCGAPARAVLRASALPSRQPSGVWGAWDLAAQPSTGEDRPLGDCTESWDVQ